MGAGSLGSAGPGASSALMPGATAWRRGGSRVGCEAGARPTLSRCRSNGAARDNVRQSPGTSAEQVTKPLPVPAGNEFCSAHRAVPSA